MGHCAFTHYTYFQGRWDETGEHKRQPTQTKDEMTLFRIELAVHCFTIKQDWFTDVNDQSMVMFNNTTGYLGMPGTNAIGGDSNQHTLHVFGLQGRNVREKTH